MLYKFINENKIQKYKGGFVVINNRIYTNPKEEILKEAGYKPLSEGDKPEWDPQTQYLSETYRDDGDVITSIYTVMDFEFMQK